MYAINASSMGSGVSSSDSCFAVSPMQAHSLKSFHDATQLSYQELCDALLALTADRQCVLLTNQPSVQEARSPTLSQEEDSYLQTMPFKINTTFVVNPAFPADIARKQKSNKVRFHEVRLVNKSHMSIPSREERTVDLAHVFERRRAIMDSAIVRILKQEKEMSVDNIAVTVSGRVGEKPWIIRLISGGLKVENKGTRTVNKKRTEQGPSNT